MRKKVSHIFLDFSSTQAFTRCRRKFNLNSVEALELNTLSDGSLSPAFRGTLVHAALDALARKISWEPVVEALVAENAALRALEPSRSGSLEHIKALIRAYEAEYQGGGVEIVATEQTLQMPISSRITWQGTVDKIIRIGDELNVMDHKCSSSLRQWVEPTIPLSDQFTGYIALAEANGFSTTKLIVDGISTALKALNDGEGLFVRYETERTLEQIENFKDRMGILGDEMIDFIEHIEPLRESISTPTAACNEFGGSKCVFMDVCTSGASGENVLKSLYRKQTNPWKNFRIVYEDTK